MPHITVHMYLCFRLSILRVAAPGLEIATVLRVRFKNRLQNAFAHTQTHSHTHIQYTKVSSNTYAASHIAYVCATNLA